MIILDANILIRFVLGRGVRRLIEDWESRVRFCASEAAFEEAREHLPRLLSERGKSDRDLPDTLDYLASLVEPIEQELYETFEGEARERLRGRDEEDWHVVAAALALKCPVWSEDQDFFGIGIPVWKTDRVEMFFQSLAEPPDDELGLAAAEE
jgi:predicted nucleic acid-binding protein